MNNRYPKLISEFCQNGRVGFEHFVKRLLGYSNAEVEKGQATEFHINLFLINAHSKQNS
jgi:hypothetical protein